MVDHTAARRPHHLWNIVRTVGLLALLGAMIMVMVVVPGAHFHNPHDHAGARAEITVVDEDP